MKGKSFLYGFVALTAVFVGAMAYLLYFHRTSVNVNTTGLGAIVEKLGLAFGTVRGEGRTVSGRSGKLLISYGGDLQGNLDPCG